LNPDTLALEICVREAFFEFVEGSPMRRGTATIKKSRFASEKSAGTHTRHSARSLGKHPHRVDQIAIASDLRCVSTARQEQRIDSFRRFV
jgi:hypothetical protein